MELLPGFATFGDMEEVSKLFLEVLNSLKYYNNLATEKERLKYTQRELEIKLTEDPLSIIVVRSGIELVGFCFSRFDDYTIWLEWFGVAQSYRGKHMGDLILQKLEISTLERGCHKIWCDSRTENIDSFKVLQKNGFTLVTTLKNHWYHQDFFIWEKLLVT